MKTILFIAAAMVLPVATILAQGEYTSNSGRVSFFAEAPVANVDAQNNKVRVTLNTSNQEITFHMAMVDFQFKNQKMGRDAQDKYLETAKYPEASFNGKFSGKVDYQKPGTYPVTATGKMKVHGVERQVTQKGTVVVAKGKVSLNAQFHVALKDFKIDTPKILGHEMTANDVQVKVSADLTEHTGLVKK
jgi:polyisoprenoid-binding protein YceI